MRVLVCGGRAFNDWTVVNDVLDGIQRVTPITCIIHGAATGADDLAERWARSEGIGRHRFPVLPAQWDKHGKAAGPMRNQAMLEKGKPDLVVAFPGGSGTADMVRRAKGAGVKVIEVSPPVQER